MEEENNKDDIPSSKENISSIKNEDNENESIKFSRVFQKEPKQKENTEDNQNIFSTRVFMKSIDLRCDDHLLKFQEDVEATRFCQKCNTLCCDSCVLDYHIEHIDLAKRKVEDYFLSQKNHIVELNNKIQESIRYKINEKEIDKIVDSQKKVIEDFFQRRKEEIEVSKKKLENVLNFEKELKDKMVKAIETFYKDECFKRLKIPIENNERLGSKIDRFIKDWAKFNKREKVSVLKNNVISDFERDSENNINQIKEEMQNFKGKSLDIEKKVNGLLENISKNDKFNELDKVYSEMNENYLNILKDIGDLKYDKLIIQKIEDIKNKKVDVDYNFKELLNDKMFNNNPEVNNQLQQHPQIPPNPQYQNLPPQQYQPNQQNQMGNNDYIRQNSEFNLFNSQKINSGNIENNNNNNFNQNNNNFNPKNNNSIYVQNNNNNFNQNNNNFNPNNNNNFNPNNSNNFNLNNNNNFNTNNNNNFNQNNNNFNQNNNNNNKNFNQNNNNNFNPNNNNNFNGNDNNNNFNNPNFKQNMVDEQIRNENSQQFTYELIMYLKEKTNDIFIYNEKYGLTKLKLPSNDSFLTFPDKSKFVNLGTSCLLTGGQTKEKKKLTKCYLITLIENDSPDHYEVNLMPYGGLKEARERHNLLFLPNKNYVFACSGFFTKTCEYTDIYKGTWELITPLSKSRGNATMAYINEQYVYILGGFDLTIDNKNGIYLDDIEYFDINNFAKGWTLINYNNNRGYHMGLTALGVVPISKNIFLICGGYDGKEYKSNVYKIDCTNHEHPTVEETQSIGNNSIFTHNMFCKIRKSYFNFDFQTQMYGFDYENWRFGLLNMNANK